MYAMYTDEIDVHRDVEDVVQMTKDHLPRSKAMLESVF